MCRACFCTILHILIGILECHHVASDWSYLLKVRAASLLALEEIVARRIKALPGIPRSQTVIVMSSAKETAILPIVAPGAGEA